MVKLVPIDGDPFAAPAAAPQAPPAGVKLIPLNHDPFNVPQVDLPTAILRGVTNPLGVAPMIGGGIQGVVDAIGGATGLKPGGTFEGGYHDFVDKAHALDDASAEQHPVGYYGGKLASGLALGSEVPSMFSLAPTAGLGARVAAGAADAGVQSAAYGGINDFGETEGSLGDRLAAGGKGAATGLATGLVLGAPLSAVGHGVAALAARRAGPASNAVIDAGARQNIPIPTYAATDSLPVQQVGHLVGSLPIVGPRMVESARTALDAADTAATRIASSANGGIIPDAASAGQSANEGITNYVGPHLDSIEEAAYDKVNNLINPAATSPLNATEAAANIIRLRRAASGSRDPGAAVRAVADAIADPAGLTYAGIKDLRSRVRGMLGAPSSFPGDLDVGELKQIKSALDDDLRLAVKNAGGPQALAAFEKANKLAQIIARRRDDLKKVIGLTGAAKDEDVYKKILSAAKDVGDHRLLQRARVAMGPDAWGAIASAASSRLGRVGGTGDFSLDRFVTEFEKMTPVGRSAIFGAQPGMLDAMNDLVTVGKRFKSLNAFKNHSNTAQNLGGLFGVWAVGGRLLAHPFLTVMGALGAPLAARALSRPATVRSMTRWMKVYNSALARPTAAGFQVPPIRQPSVRRRDRKQFRGRWSGRPNQPGPARADGVSAGGCSSTGRWPSRRLSKQWPGRSPRRAERRRRQLSPTESGADVEETGRP
jgi:hypothetical protein